VFVPPPPPPPVAGPGGPPPPGAPPPPPGAKSAAAALRWRQLHWEVIPAMRIQGTVFERMRDAGAGVESSGGAEGASPPSGDAKALRGIESLIDHDALKDLFAQSKADDPSAKRRKSLGGDRTGSLGADDGKGFVSLLDLKRGSNVEIMLSQISLTLPEIADAVRALDDAKLDVEHVDMMLRYLPTSDELALLASFEGDRARLGKAERYFSALASVAGHASKMKALRFKQGFRSATRDVKAWVNTVDAFCAELKNSTRLGRLVALVLNLGNALHATRGVAAAGFSLSSLPKLLDTRSFDGSTTLLHYMVAHLEREREARTKEKSDSSAEPSAAEISASYDCPLLFAEELPSLVPASRLTFAMLDEELAPLRSGLKALEHELILATSRVEEAERRAKEQKEKDRDRAARFYARSARADARYIAGDDEDVEAAEDATRLKEAELEARERKNAAEETAFRESVARFHADAKAELDALAASVASAKKRFADAARYYGEDAAKTQKNTPLEPERFARVIKNFADLLDSARKDRGKVEAALFVAGKEKDSAKEGETATRVKETIADGGEREAGDAKKKGDAANEKDSPAKSSSRALTRVRASSPPRKTFSADDVLEDIKRGDAKQALRKVAPPVMETPFWKREGELKRREREEASAAGLAAKKEARDAPAPAPPAPPARPAGSVRAPPPPPPPPTGMPRPPPPPPSRR
jgi:hypothetical protein